MMSSPFKFWKIPYENFIVSSLLAPGSGPLDTPGRWALGSTPNQRPATHGEDWEAVASVGSLSVRAKAATPKVSVPVTQKGMP